ncbi:MAG: ExbD/TolR family protein [Bacteroidales bacterium]
MAKFRKEGTKRIPQISTASLPDIIFMLIFFFMVSTTIRETNVKVQNVVPEATEVKKLERKDLVSYIYIGEPKPQFQDMFGTEPRIQLNDAFARVEDIQDYIATERQQLSESERPQMTTSLKVDEETNMGVVTDVKTALRRASALKIMYTSREVDRVY